MSSALASVGALAAGTATARAPTNATRLSGKDSRQGDVGTFRGRNARGAARGARLSARAEAITDAPEMDAKAEEVRSRDVPLPNPATPVIRRTRDVILSENDAQHAR